MGLKKRDWPPIGKLRWKSSRRIKFLLFFLLAFILFVFLMGNVTGPETYDLRLYEKSPATLRSPITLKDIHKTNELQEAAVAAVEPVYQVKKSITNNQLQTIHKIFAFAEELRTDDDRTAEERLVRLDELVTYKLSDKAFNALLQLPQETLETAEAMVTNTVGEVMQAGVRDIQEGMKKAEENINGSLALTQLDNSARQMIRELTLASILPNIVYNEQATKELQEAAKNSVQPVVINKDDILVEKGEVIDQETFRQLELVGLTKSKPVYWALAALAMMIIILVSSLHFFISRTYPALSRDNSQLLLMVLVMLLTLGIMKIAGIGAYFGLETVGYLAPVALGTMLISLLIDVNLALACGGILALSAGIMFNGNNILFPFDFRYGFLTLFGSWVGAYALGKARQRRNIIRAGFLVAASNLIIITILTMLYYAPFNWKQTLESFLLGITGGLLSAVLTIGFLPFFEGAFRILSPVKLIELSNPNHPLLRRLLLDAPGTYHHSIIVGNLAEAACEAIGADGLLARVGSYYHDVGKLQRPNFFIENQMNRDNPHDRISPELSKTIIIAHPYDGAEMLKQHRMPQTIIDIAEQHHGTTLLKYFHHKACEEAGASVPEENYRYPGPLPQSKEVAVVEICDCVEAATRSMAQPTPEKIEMVVRGIIKDKLDDGQFAECDITLKELELVAKSVCETLLGTFHSRIEYPSQREEVREVNNA